MNDEDERDERQQAQDQPLDDEALEQVVGGSLIVHELSHVVQQRTTVDSNETITIQGDYSMDTTPKRS